MEATFADGILVISDDEAKEQEEDYHLDRYETEKKYQKKIMKNYSETRNSDLNAEHESSSEEDDDDEYEGNDSYKAQDEMTINQILDNLKVKLTGGTIAPMFSRGPLYFNGQWPINCHACNVHGILTLKQLKIHINKRNHKRIVMRKTPLKAVRYNSGLKQVYSTKKPKLNNLIHIFPGERITEITPELQNRIMPVRENPFLPELNKLSKLQISSLSKWEPLHIYNQKAPLIGLSYCFKMHYYEVIGYYCSLCDSHSAHSLYNHLIGDRHRVKYADKHFPRLIARISFYLVDMTDQKAKQKIIHEIIRNIYRSIELKRGFRKVHIHELRSYTHHCAKFCAKNLHYGDNHVLTTDEELREMVEKCLKGENLLEPDPPNIMEEFRYLKAAEHSRSMNEEPLEKREPHLEDSADNWHRYQRMIGAALDNIDERYSNYERMPERHPSYKKEWRKFWNRRVREIEKDGLNPDDYDFEREWIPYWKQMMPGYYTTAISKAKFRIKKKLRLPFGTRSPSPIRNPLRSQHLARSSSPVLPACSRRTRSRSPECHERRTESPQAIAAKPLEPPGVVSVLRLLTALESNLGSLGTKAVEYLSKSLLYEKDTGENANRLLLKKEYYVFFITAKENLKGQLIAKIIKKRRKIAATRAIKEIETLIEMFDDFCKRTGKTVLSPPQNDDPQTSKQQEPRLTTDDQYGVRSQDDSSKNRQKDFDRNRDDDDHYVQYPREGSSRMDQYRSSGGNNNNQDGRRSQNHYDVASAHQYKADAQNSNQYDQKRRSMSSYSNQESSSNQYSRGGQGGMWQSGTSVTFRDNSNYQGSGSNSGGGNYGKNGNQGNQTIQNFHNDHDRNLSASYGGRVVNYKYNPDGERGGNHSFKPDSRSGVNYNSYLGNLAGNYNNSSIGHSGNLNTLHSDVGDNHGIYNRDCYNYSQNRSTVAAVLNQQHLGSYSGYNYSNMNAQSYGGRYQ